LVDFASYAIHHIQPKDYRVGHGTHAIKTRTVKLLHGRGRGGVYVN